MGFDLSPHPVSSQPRAEGLVRIGARGPASRLATLRHQGSAKALLPVTHGPGLHAVLLNTAGGITGGDRFAYDAHAEDDARLTLATQTAERAYRVQPGEIGEVRTTLTIGVGARIDWLAQETILFDRAALSRRLEVDMAPDATLLAVEPLVFGRAAMGETVRDLHFSDQWRIRRGGRLIYADALRLDGDASAILAGPATAAGDLAMASLVLIAPNAETKLDGLRALLPPRGGASLVRDGVLAARLTAPDGFTLRRHLMPVLEHLNDAPLPKVWTM